MSEGRQGSDRAARGPVRAALGWGLANLPFVAAAAVLVASLVVWYSLDLALVKLAVPPPETVTLIDQRLVSFPVRIGPYQLAEDGTLIYDRRTGQPIFDGKPDGLAVVSPELLVELGTKDHEMNWYYFATYYDTRLDDRDPRAYVRLDITYYTGLLDAVPHVGALCIFAAGGRVDPGESGAVPLSLPKDKAPENWREIELYRTAYELKGQRRAQYHVFSVNGDPTASWVAVRLDLMSPWTRYCYFAKVQMVPVKNVNRETSEEVCLEFARVALPEVLKYLPTAAHVRQLEAAEGP